MIFDPASSNYFVLFSGRWFLAPSLAGPWAYATPNLPASFAAIPAGGPHAAVLASVPGTAQAQQAVIMAQIPQQASLPVNGGGGGQNYSRPSGSTDFSQLNRDMGARQGGFSGGGRRR